MLWTARERLYFPPGITIFPTPPCTGRGFGNPSALRWRRVSGGGRGGTVCGGGGEGEDEEGEVDAVAESSGVDASSGSFIT
jgi:hypothetical protein